MENLIELRRLCKTYDSGEAEVEALHDVDLSIGEGEFVSIGGQSGSGKSTLDVYKRQVQPQVARREGRHAAQLGREEVLLHQPIFLKQKV